jgi:Xaa-Pro aminopeptidase
MILSEELEGFRRVQRLAYDTSIEVASDLRPGTTEKEAARILERALSSRGVKRYFHQPFAWFGDRTKFAGFRRISPEFFPTDRALEKGMIAILDVAPIVDGYTADIGYTFREGGPDEALTDALDTLRDVRALIPECVSRGDTMRSIYLRIETLFRERGYDNRHERYPFGVLGHRVHHLKDRKRDPRVLGFGITSAIDVLGGELWSRLSRRERSPLWARENRPLEPGIWAIEPHLGGVDFGAKFEEILVVETHRAFWLDDALPHVKAA